MLISSRRASWRPARNQSEQNGPPGKGWIPVDLNADGSAVRWIRAGTDPLNLPFFRQSVDRLRATGSPECETRLAILDCRRPSSFEPAGIVVHMTRCGSTLVVNALRKMEDVVGISEARPVDKIMALTAAQSSYLADLCGGYLAPLVSVFSDYPDGGQRKVVIKCGTNAMNCLRGVRRVWPAVPCVVMIRNPLEVAVSNISSPPPWIIEWFRDPHACPFGMPPPSVIASGAIHDLSAWVLGRFCAETLQMLGPACRVIDYDCLTLENMLSIGEYFGIASARDSVDRVAEAFQFDAKRPNQVYQSDRDKKKQAVTREIQLSVETWVADSYELLRQRAHGEWRP